MQVERRGGLFVFQNILTQRDNGITRNNTHSKLCKESAEVEKYN